MKILLIAPLVYPLRFSPNYQGIERLVREYAERLYARGHQVTVVAVKGSELIPGIELIPTLQGNWVVENDSLKLYKDRLKEFDVIHDFSHYHSPSMNVDNLPAINVFWHDPYIAKFQEPKYNVVSLSQWGANRFKDIYQQYARYQETIMVSSPMYRPMSALNNHQQAPHLPKGDVGHQLPPDRPPVDKISRHNHGIEIDLYSPFITLGKQSPEKGNLEAMRLCRKLGVSLDVVGGISPGDDDTYSKVVERLSTGKIKYRGNCTEEVKIQLLQRAEALIYCPGQTEIHSHKIVEALFCGCPVITFEFGPAKEVLGDFGYLAKDEEDFLHAMQEYPGRVNRESLYRYSYSRWSSEAIIPAYEKLYGEVANGLRW